MKKFWKSLAFALVGVFALSSCEDVPAPYPNPNNNGGNDATTDLITVNFVSGQGKWTIEDKTSSSIWSHDSQYGMKASAFKSGNKVASESWLVSPEIDLTNATKTTMVVEEAINKIDAGDPKEMMTVWATTDNGATWEPLTANARPAGTSWTMQEDKFDLSAYDGKKLKVAFKYVSTTESAGTWEIKTVKVQGTGSATIEGGDTPTPTGTEVTCAEAVALTEALADGATSTEVYTITGYITEVVGTPSKNQQTFWMADTKDGGKVFEAYWANLPEGVTAFVKGSKVKITGNLIKYVKDGKVTPEIKNATVEILEAGDGGDPTPGPTPTGTDVTCAEAVALTNALADGATSTETYSVTGYITSIIGSVSTKTGTPQQSFWMADTKDGGQVFQAYYANVPDGVTEFTKGAKVKLTGNLIKYVKNGTVTAEIKNGNVEILEAGDGGNGGDDPTPGPTPSGDPVAGFSFSSVDIVSGATGSVALDTNKYGSQAVATQSTWYTFAVNGASFTGCKICIATDANGGGIQMQGNDSDASKQGFLTNVTPFKPIKTITVTLRVVNSSTYDPNFSLYAGTSTHPTANAITGSMDKTEGESFRTYTFTFDLSAGDYSFFTIANDKAGALYIDNINVVTK